VLETIHEIFNNKRLRRILLKLRYPIAFLLAVVFFRQIRVELFLYGFIVSMIGEAIQVWCFASLNKETELAANGPYILLRNPMYVGRYFLILGLLLLTGSVSLLIIYTIIYYFYMVNRVKREEAVLINIFGTPYENYCREVNRFMPSFNNFNLDKFWYFKWKLFFQNNAHWNILSLLLVYIALYFFKIVNQ